MLRTAISLIAYNRPIFFEQTLKSIMANPEATDMPFILFLDGPQTEVQQRQRDIFAGLAGPDQHVVVYDQNVGCGLNIIYARKYLFENLEMDRVFVFEDDLVVSPHYLGLMDRLMYWCELHYSDVGVVQGYWPCRETVGWKVKHLGDVATGNPHWWGYLMSRRAWDAIKPSLWEYARTFLIDRAYWMRDEMAIRRWARGKLNQWDGTYQGDRQFPYEWHDQYTYWQRTDHPLPASGQDGMTALTLQCAGLKKVNLIVNRAKNIGSSGMHTSPQSWQRNRMDEIFLDNFSIDSEMNTFKAVQA